MLPAGDVTSGQTWPLGHDVSAKILTYFYPQTENDDTRIDRPRGVRAERRGSRDHERSGDRACRWVRQDAPRLLSRAPGCAAPVRRGRGCAECLPWCATSARARDDPGDSRYAAVQSRRADSPTVAAVGTSASSRGSRRTVSPMALPGRWRLVQEARCDSHAVAAACSEIRSAETASRCARHPSATQAATRACAIRPASRSGRERLPAQPRACLDATGGDRSARPS